MTVTITIPSIILWMLGLVASIVILALAFFGAYVLIIVVTSKGRWF